MTNALPLSSRIYGRLLIFYPEDLRRDHEADMALVFAEDLDTARSEEGMRGVIRVWRCALFEFMRFALPAHASSPAVTVPAIWFALCTTTMSGEMAFAVRHAAHMPAFFDIVRAALLLPCLSTPLIPLAVWACRRNPLISLDLVSWDLVSRDLCKTGEER